MKKQWCEFCNMVVDVNRVVFFDGGKYCCQRCGCITVSIKRALEDANRQKYCIEEELEEINKIIKMLKKL